jgi:hypothetical protein
VGWRHVEPKLLHEPSQAGSLAFRKVEHQPGQSRGVDDRVLERALEAPTHEPRVERVMAVLDENSTMSEA